MLQLAIIIGALTTLAIVIGALTPLAIIIGARTVTSLPSRSKVVLVFGGIAASPFSFFAGGKTHSACCG
jgi:hypothetical protein